MAEALYRKYRPQKFSEVVGQEHIVSLLEAGVKNGQTAHAYLFTGTRGTGKTSVARILARALGCAPEDLVEIDAASNTGVDDIRELQEGVRTLPFRSPVKVYIIDEVHMLSKSAFNALLKTLEEPPAHVVFILATTEVHKVPETIASRCEVYHFKSPTVEILTKVLTRIAKSEEFKLGRGVAELLAMLGDGSFRDAIGNLQKVANISGDKEITLAEAEQVTNTPAEAKVWEIIEAVAASNLDMALKLVQEAVADGKDTRSLLKLLIRNVRLVMLYGFSTPLRAELAAEAGEDVAAKLKALSGSKDNLTRWPSVLRELLQAYLETYAAAVPSLPLELALIKILTTTNK